MGHHPHLLHPLDWTGYLRQSLVLSSTPVALTLLVLAAHCHACCHHHSQRSFSAVVGNETSVLGTVFAGASWVFLGANTTASNGVSCIPTPWHPHQSDRQVAGQPFMQEEGEAEYAAEAEQQTETDTASVFAERNLVLHPATFLQDPFTIAYSAWEYMSGTPEAIQVQEKPQPLSSSSSCEWMKKMRQRQHQQHRQAQQDTVASADSASIAIWTDICLMHAVGMLGVVCALLPSVFVSSGLLACNRAIPQVKSLTLPYLQTRP